MPVHETFRIIALRVAHSGFWIANVLTPRGEGETKGGMRCRRPGLCVWFAREQFLCVSPPGAVCLISPLGEGYAGCTRVVLTSGAMRPVCSKVVSYLSSRGTGCQGCTRRRSPPRVSPEVSQRSVQLQMGTRAIYYRVDARGSVSGRHVSSISAYCRFGHCVRYRRQGQSVRYGTRAVSPSGAPHNLSGMHAAISTSRGRFRRSHSDRYIMTQRGSLVRPKEVVVLGSTASRVSLNDRVPMCEIAW